MSVHTTSSHCYHNSVNEPNDQNGSEHDKSQVSQVESNDRAYSASENVPPQPNGQTSRGYRGSEDYSDDLDYIFTSGTSDIFEDLDPTKEGHQIMVVVDDDMSNYDRSLLQKAADAWREYGIDFVFVGEESFDENDPAFQRAGAVWAGNAPEGYGKGGARIGAEPGMLTRARIDPSSHDHYDDPEQEMIETWAHELGHAIGLEHDLRNDGELQVDSDILDEYGPTYGSVMHDDDDRKLFDADLPTIIDAYALKNLGYNIQLPDLSWVAPIEVDDPSDHSSDDTFSVIVSGRQIELTRDDYDEDQYVWARADGGDGDWYFRHPDGPSDLWINWNEMVDDTDIDDYSIKWDGTSYVAEDDDGRDYAYNADTAQWRLTDVVDNNSVDEEPADSDGEFTITVNGRQIELTPDDYDEDQYVWARADGGEGDWYFRHPDGPADLWINWDEMVDDTRIDDESIIWNGAQYIGFDDDRQYRYDTTNAEWQRASATSDPNSGSDGSSSQGSDRWPIVVLDFDRTLDHGPGDNEINRHAIDFIMENRNNATFIIVSANGSLSTIEDALEEAGISDYIEEIYYDTGNKEDEFNDIADDYGTEDYRYFFFDDRRSNIESWKDSDLYEGDRNYLLVSNDGDDGGTASDFNKIEDWIDEG